MPVEQERLDADVLIVGAGPAGLACALHLSRLIAQHNAAGAKPELSAENIYVLEKAREIGAHQLSGAVMDPRGLAELVPDWEKTAPLESPVTDDAAYVLTSSSAWKLADHAAAAAKSRQLHRLPEQTDEMARRPGGKSRRKFVHAICGRGI